MPINSRAKGARREREFFAILENELGISCKRNLQQTRSGGADSYDVPGWAIEVKACEQLAFGPAWEQAERQANGNRPALAWKQSRRPWAVYLDLNDMMPDTFPRRGSLCRIDAQAFCQLVREAL